MFKTFRIFIFLLKLLVLWLIFEMHGVETKSALEYSERLYYIPFAFLEGYFCNFHSVRKFRRES